jgi:hypothetical protein
VQIHANCVLNNGYKKMYEIPFLRLGGAGETFRQHRPLNFAILEKWMTCKLRNWLCKFMLIIDSKKNQIFLMGGAGVTHIYEPPLV